MIHRYVRSPRRLIVVAAFAIVALSAFGFAASNTIADGGNAGDGDATISGFTITNISYDVNNTNPTVIDTVTFDVSPAVTGEAKVKFNNDPDWYDCGTGASLSCDLTSGSVDVLNATNIRVIAAN
jgi:hypothetical protein